MVFSAESSVHCFSSFPELFDVIQPIQCVESDAKSHSISQSSVDQLIKYLINKKFLTSCIGIVIAD